MSSLGVLFPPTSPTGGPERVAGGTSLSSISQTVSVTESRDRSRRENEDAGDDRFLPAVLQSIVDPATLSQAQELGADTEDLSEVAFADDRLETPQEQAEAEEADQDNAVGLDGRPETAQAGEVAGEDQDLDEALEPEPLEVPNINPDPDEEFIEVFNERLARTNEVLAFLTRAPADRSSSTGISLIV